MDEEEELTLSSFDDYERDMNGNPIFDGSQGARVYDRVAEGNIPELHSNYELNSDDHPYREFDSTDLDYVTESEYERLIEEKVKNGIITTEDELEDFIVNELGVVVSELKDHLMEYGLGMFEYYGVGLGSR